MTWVEADVQRTRDGRLVVTHDRALKRTTNAVQVYPRRAPWRVADFTAAAIARLDAGSWFSSRFAGERVHTLACYLRRLDRNGQGLLLEIKSPWQYAGIETQVITRLHRAGWLGPGHVRDRLVIPSLSADAIREVHRLRLDVTTGILGAPKAAGLRDYARFADQINPRADALSRSYVKAVHRLKGSHGTRIEVYTWDVKNAVTARKLASYGVDGVII